MKGFLKVTLSILALFAAAFGVLVLIDQLSNRNRIKCDYLECDSTEDE